MTSESSERTSDLSGQLAAVLGELRQDLPGIRRIALALHDPGSDLLHTFAHATDGASPLSFYARRLDEVPSLAVLAAERRARVLDDLDALPEPRGEHTVKLLEKGYRSSYTRPLVQRDRFIGFLFYDADERAYFSETVLHHLGVYSRLIELLLVDTLAVGAQLRSAVALARDLSRHRDEETGAHVDRMGGYAQAIARRVAFAEARSDEWVEHVSLLAPLHDIGKIAIPDHVLQKPGRLTDEEWGVMRGHVARGVAIVEAMTTSFGLDATPEVNVLRNIVAFHHEYWDGSGYPYGRRGREIPLEARIVAVADVYDALTSVRSYKAAWSNRRALAFLAEHAGTRYDVACVAALAAAAPEVEAIQRHFGLLARAPGINTAEEAAEGVEA